MAGGTSAPTDTTETTSHVNTEYDSDQDGVVEAADRAFKIRSVQSESDLPSNAEEDEIYYVKDENSIYVEDGN